MERYDIAIIGTGPAGVSAAITAKIRGRKILLIGNNKISDKVSKAHIIKNYPGFQDSVRSCKLPILHRKSCRSYCSY